MTSNKEKIKAFLNDEKKMEALLNDEEFMNKVSNEEATAETYKEEFKKFDIELSDDEANQIKDTISKIFKTPTEELNDEFLKDVAGGGYDYIDNKNKMNQQMSQGTSSSVVGVDKAIGIGVAAASTLWLASAIGIRIAGKVYEKKADIEWDNQEKKHWDFKYRDLTTYGKYLNTSEKLNDIAARILTFGAKDGYDIFG